MCLLEYLQAFISFYEGLLYTIRDTPGMNIEKSLDKTESVFNQFAQYTSTDLEIEGYYKRELVKLV